MSALKAVGKGEGPREKEDRVCSVQNHCTKRVYIKCLFVKELFFSLNTNFCSLYSKAGGKAKGFKIPEGCWSFRTLHC